MGMKLLYSLSFLLGMDNWKIDPTPNELTESLADLSKDKSTLLDLGCGDGRDCLTLARAGWQVLGVDFIPLAIRKARQAAAREGLSGKAGFLVGDVTRLKELDLPAVDFAYDIGCFHLLDAEQAKATVAGLAAVVKPGGAFLLKAFTPRQQGKRTVGYEQAEIEALFSPHFTVERTSDHSYWRFPARWYWMRKAES